jgi:hypothetical protein
MKIFGISLGTIIFFFLIWFVARRWGDSVPGLNAIG